MPYIVLPGRFPPGRPVTTGRDGHHSQAEEEERDVVAAGLFAGFRTDSCVTYIHNEVKLSSAWDHFPVYAVVQGREKGRGCVKSKKGGRVTMENKWNSRRTCWQPKEETLEICLEKSQKDIDDAAKGIAQNTNFGKRQGSQLCSDKSCSKLFEDTENWKKEVERHPGEVYLDLEKTTEEQKQRIEWYTGKGIV